MATLGLVLGGRSFLPLYDGVVPVEPYRWLAPPPGQQGSPQGATATVPISGGESPLVTVATPEAVPQAQIFAIPGGLNLPPGSTALQITIAAIAPPPASLPEGQVITGNVYAISVTNQAGVTVTAKPDAEVSVVLRAPDPLQTTATVVRFDGSSWQGAGPESADVAATFETVVTEFGDYALLADAPAPTAAGGSAEPPSGAPPIGAPPSGAPPSGAATSGATGAPGPATSADPGATASGSGGSGRELLAVGLGGLAVLIVVLVAIATLRRGRPSGSSSGAGTRRRR